MKFIKLIFLSIATTAILAACGGSGHKHHEGHGHDSTSVESTEAMPHGEGKEFTSAYVCPMHCEGSGSDQAGQCPVCGMDYVALKEHIEDGHKH